MATSTHQSTYVSLLGRACRDGDSKWVRRRLNKFFGDDVDQRSGKFLFTPLLFALRKGHLNIAWLLMREGADVTLKDSHGHNLIHISIISEKVDVTLWAIDHGAAKGVGVNDQTDRGGTPLMLSVKLGTIGICTLLLSKGSDPSILDISGGGG